MTSRLPQASRPEVVHMLSRMKTLNRLLMKRWKRAAVVVVVVGVAWRP
jgi:hypothetical protein